MIVNTLKKHKTLTCVSAYRPSNAPLVKCLLGQDVNQGYKGVMSYPKDGLLCYQAFASPLFETYIVYIHKAHNKPSDK